MPFDGGVSAGRADVEFTANTGQAKVSMEELRAVYKQTTGAMSTEALRAAAAQEKLDRAIALHGPASTQAKTATVAYRRELEALKLEQASVTVGTGRMGGGFRQSEREIERMGRGALVGTGLLRGLGRAASFASFAFIGGAGLVYALRSTLSAEKEHELALAQTANAVHDAGLPWGSYRGQINAATLALEHHTAFSQDKLLGSFSLIVRRTQDVGKAFTILAAAADLSRSTNGRVGLEQAVSVLLRAQNGQTAGLSRLGIQVPKVTAAQDALRASGEKLSAQQIAEAKAADKLATSSAVLARVRQQTAGSAAAYAKSEAGAQDAFNNSLRHSEEIIGGAVRPELKLLLADAAAYLDRLNKTGELQRDVNTVLHDAGQVVGVVKDGYHVLAPIVREVDNALGGLKGTLELLIALKVASSLAGWRGGLLGLIGSRSGATGLAGAESKAGLLQGRLASLAKIGAVTIGIDLLFRSHGDKGAKSVLEQLAGGGLLGVALGGARGGIFGIGLAAIPEVWNLGQQAGGAVFGGGGSKGITPTTPAQAAHLKIPPSPFRDPRNIASPYPFGAPVGRVDQGVDYSRPYKGPVYAIGDGVVYKIDPVGSKAWGGGGAIYYQLDNPVRVNGRIYSQVYTAETGRILVSVGDRVKRGQQIAFTASGWQESGFAKGGGPLAPVIGGLGAGTQPTQAGRDFLTLVHGAGSLGGTTTPAGTTGDGGGKPPAPKVDVSFSLQNQLLDAQLRNSQRDQLAVLKKEHDSYLELLKQKGLSHAEILQLKQALLGVDQQIQTIEDDIARSAKQSADKRRAALAKAHREELRAVSTLPKSFDIEERHARALGGAGGVTALLSVYAQELLYQKAVIAQIRARHEPKDVLTAALDEEAKIQERIAKTRQDAARRAREATAKANAILLASLAGPSIEQQIREAKISLLAPGPKRDAEELALLEQELRDEKKKLALALARIKDSHLRKEAELAGLLEEGRIEQRIRDLKNQQAANQGALTREFVSEYTNLVGSYAPNVLGGRGPGGSSVVVVQQNFPHPPTADGHREATYAAHAARARFE